MYRSHQTIPLEPYLPRRVAELLEPLRMEHRAAEEIRLRAGQPIQICYAGADRLIHAPNGRAAVTAEECGQIVSAMCGQSIYAWENELAQGFLTLEGGYRVGVCGRAVTEGGRIVRLTDFSGLNIRIAREVFGAANAVAPYLQESRRLCPTLILSRPGDGKTTLLRDAARRLSYGGYRVCVLDTRYELAGVARGKAFFDLGPRTDVLCGVTRAEGMPMLIRSMSPQLLVTDELADAGDIAAVREALMSGVAVLASAHASTVEEFRARIGDINSMPFERYILLGRSNGVGTVEAILDADGNRLLQTEERCQRYCLCS